MSRFWINGGEDRNARELQILIYFFVKETGGKIYYEGLNMAPTHRGPDWTSFIKIVLNVAGDVGVGPDVGCEVMSFLTALRQMS